MAKICTVGSATQDIFLLTEGAQTVRLQSNNSTHTYMIFQQGAKIPVAELHYAVGGGAANAAVGLSRLGHTVQTYFCITDDNAGQMVKNQMSTENVAIDHIQVANQGATATSFIIPSVEKNHIVFVYRGANKHLSAQNFPLQLLQSLDYLFICPLTGTGKKFLCLVAREAKKCGVKIAVNPGLGQLINNTDSFIAQLPYIDYLILNAREAATLLDALAGNPGNVQEDRLCKIPASSRPVCADCKPTESSYRIPCFILEYMQKLITCGPSVLVVTNGSAGVYVATKDIIYFHPSLNVEPVSALGAGDAFASGFMGALAHKKTVEEAIVFGVINASSVIQSLDAQEGLLSLEEIEKRVRNKGVSLLKSYSLK